MSDGMVNLTIDGISVEVPAGQSLLLAARAQGIEIPTLCSHEELKPSGHCRMCMVEIGQAPATRLVNSCTFPAEEGMIVQTASDQVLQARRIVLELLLARCPQATLLQQMAADMGIYQTRFQLTETPEDLCILCGMCVRTCAEVVGVSAISMAYRTPHKQVSTPFLEESAACIGCGSCAFVCPTNVIDYVEKDGIRTIWGRDFEMQPCTACGNYIAPKYQLEHWAKITGDPVEYFYVCRDCR